MWVSSTPPPRATWVAAAPYHLDGTGKPSCRAPARTVDAAQEQGRHQGLAITLATALGFVRVRRYGGIDMALGSSDTLPRWQARAQSRSWGGGCPPGVG